MAERALPSWFYKVGHESLQMIRRMPRSAAQVFLEVKHPDLTPEEADGALELAGTKLELSSTQKTDPHQRLFVAAAWLCGASFAQLGAMFNVTRQTMSDKVNRTLPMVSNREALRLRPAGSLDNERLVAMKDLYYRMVEAEPLVFANTDAMTLAKVLDQTPDTSGPQLPAVPEPDPDDRMDD